MRWAKVVGWLMVVGSIGLAATLATGAASERELVEVSLYLVLAFGFGVGLLIAVRMARSSAPTSRAKAFAAAVVIGLVAASVAAFARWYFFRHFW